MIEVSMLGACPKEAQVQVHDLLKALIVTDRENFRIREIAMIAGSGKEEIRICLSCDLAQDPKSPTWSVKQRGAWAGSRMIRKSPVSVFLTTSSTCQGPAESVVAFWRALNFEVAYDVIKDATVGTCHSQGFAVSTRWSHVRDQRSGPLKEHLSAVTLLEVSIQVSHESDAVAAEGALEAFALKLLPFELQTCH